MRATSTYSPVPLPTLGWETFTPEMAQEVLDHSKNFRKYSEAKVRRLQRRMEDGTFYPGNGETIKFGPNPLDQVDGQNRFLAQVRAKKTITWPVVRGVTEEAEKTIDTGTTRKVQQGLAGMGITHSTTAASFARWEEFYRTGSRPDCQDALADHLAFASKDDPHVRAAVAMGASVGSSHHCKGAPSGQIALLYYLAQKNGVKEQADAFLEKVKTGLNITSSDDPARTYREKMLPATSGKTIKEEIKFRFLILAWNRYIQGRPLKLLRWGKQEETRDEQIPRFIFHPVT